MTKTTFRCLRSALALGIAAVLAGCAVGPDYKRPQAPVAKEYAPQPIARDTASASGPGGESQHLLQSMDIPGQWWTLFHSQALNGLIDDALRHNADAEAAHAALKVAWEAAYAQRGAYFPTVDANANAIRQDTANDVASNAASNASLYNLTTAQVTVSYVLDLWGGNRRQVESLVAQANQQRYQLEATYLTLTSNVANAAIEEASLRAQIRATHDIIDAQTRILDTLRKQHALGDVSDAAVAAQITALEQSKATLPPLDKQLAQQRDLLAALTGRTPDQRMDAQFTLDSLQLPTDLPLSLPAQLVEQRPDVRMAEEQLHSASAQVGVAIANRLPNVQITGSLGGTSEKASKVFSAGSGFWSLGASVTQPLFDGGTLKHKQRGAEAAYQQAAAQYRSAVLQAVQNVADTLHAIDADAQALAANERAERAAAHGLEVAKRQLALGDLSESAMLNSELAWQQTALALVQARAARYADTVALFQALGGGWWHRKDADDVASEAQPARQ
ncbi:efflux transporter, outer membrane factor (OMF) lipoprotein, NodT family [Dyella jiangningensis]|uniref:efflux transporter outer membrane subunit n=1 Tax=Dyella sp. AtDHG13 TaxID=1938897 RepID=UPI00088FCDB2|nr:efflux transporter outer membrane subunit [Dyella sp. AtDHG13]PXV59476.1 NodT family efflux transporter outer membrane factor (OMF) lipoprotein [Dyella sp. AtDHG13]SDJ16593.1 efflux transporter, outer membrane factor (OMF) lipoprotein, NodT family [Dyella jiangningensis]